MRAASLLLTSQVCAVVSAAPEGAVGGRGWRKAAGERRMAQGCRKPAAGHKHGGMVGGQGRVRKRMHCGLGV